MEVGAGLPTGLGSTRVTGYAEVIPGAAIRANLDTVRAKRSHSLLGHVRPKLLQRRLGQLHGTMGTCNSTCSATYQVELQVPITPTGSASRHNGDLQLHLIRCTAGRSQIPPRESRSRCWSHRSTPGCRSRFRWFLRERSGTSRNWMSVRRCRSVWSAKL